MPYTMLFRRGAVWTFRKVVPLALRPLIGKTQLIVSLRTADLETAKARYPAELAKATRLLATAQVTMRRPEAATERIGRRLVQESPPRTTRTSGTSSISPSLICWRSSPTR